MKTTSQWIRKNLQHFDPAQLLDLTLLLKPLGGLNSDAGGLYVEGSVSNLRHDVLNVQTDNTLDPGAAPVLGDRYIIEDAANLHVNFGVMVGVEDDDVVEYDGSDFVVAYDASTDMDDNALTWNIGDDTWRHFDGSSWHIHTGLSSLIAGDGLIISAGQIDLVPDVTTGGNIIPITVTANGVGVDTSTLGGRPIKENHVITAGEEAAGFFILTQTPESASLVSATPVGGPQQVNAATGTATADFDILGAANNEFHFNNNGVAVGLSGDLLTGHEMMLEYIY